MGKRPFKPQPLRSKETLLRSFAEIERVYRMPSTGTVFALTLSFTYLTIGVKIRLPDGSTLRNNFAATDTLRTILSYVESEKGLGNHSLSTAFPSKLYTESDLELSLKEAGKAGCKRLVIFNLLFVIRTASLCCSNTKEKVIRYTAV